MADILVFSNEEWSEMWYSKHHWALELSKKHQVYFVNPAASFSLFASKTIKVSELKHNLKLIQYKNILPGTGRWLFIKKLNEKWIAKKLGSLFKNGTSVVALSFDPFRCYLPSFLSNKSYYYAADDYKTIFEKVICENSSQCFAVSSILQEKLKPWCSSCLLIPHGVPTTEEPVFQVKNKVENVLCAATLSARINWKLLLELAQQNALIQFHFYGPLLNETSSNEHFVALKNKGNAHFHGLIAYAKLQEKIKEADVCLVPYQMTQRGNQINSLKILQYLSYGKTTFSSFFSDYKEIAVQKPDLIYLFDSEKEFIKSFKDYCEKPQLSQELALERFRFAAQFFYPQLVQKFYDILDD